MDPLAEPLFCKETRKLTIETYRELRSSDASLNAAQKGSRIADKMSRMHPHLIES